MAEQFNFGGELCTRREIIAYLKSIGSTQAMIDRYLQGLDLSKRIRADDTVELARQAARLLLGAFQAVIQENHL